ncbi:two-component sensor histidine kinase [filamentous cyanobacterium CCP1]|nr:two-component sensor histidine kinase [filamentous cyanobacterium CCP2]PSB67130.1 two-component sensor histidine kinase [filamentous cyanobacterium CCP1]
MNQNNVFRLTRLRLAGLYAGTMGVILILWGVVFDKAMTHSHWSELNHRLESVAGTLHDGLEVSLRQPGTLEPIMQQFLPTLCIAGTDCANQPPPNLHQLGVFQEDGYYIRFLDLSGRLLASAGNLPTDFPTDFPTELSNPIEAEPWQTLEASDGTRYRQISLRLKTADQVPWGYMQVGRSLQDLEGHLLRVRVVLLVGLPTAMVLVITTGWWLAGQAMQPVYNSYRQMQQFTADAAHELRTPLAAIQATLESTLTTTPASLDATEAWDTLRTLERQNSRLSELVQDLLFLSRMDLQDLPPKQQPCCLNDLVQDLVEEFAALAIAAKVDLKAIQSPIPLVVFGNEEQLYRMVTNLMTNAIQYTREGGQVTIGLQPDDHHAILRVQDTGIGISLQDQSRIFDRFYRVSSDRSRQTGGAGLGLAIAKSIAHGHHGTITVQSELGKGSIFTVRLPLPLVEGIGRVSY